MSCQSEIRLTDIGDSFHAELRKLTKLEAAVGIMSDGRQQQDGNPDIVDIAIWNEFGTYASPARPFISTTLDNYKSQIEEAMRTGAEMVLNGSTAEEAFDTIGIVGKAAAQQNVVDGNWEPNSSFTVDGGWMRNKKSGKWFFSEGKGSMQPLIDTGYMRNQIQYVVRPRTDGQDV